MHVEGRKLAVLALFAASIVPGVWGPLGDYFPISEAHGIEAFWPFTFVLLAAASAFLTGFFWHKGLRAGNIFLAYCAIMAVLPWFNFTSYWLPYLHAGYIAVMLFDLSSAESTTASKDFVKAA